MKTFVVTYIAEAERKITRHEVVHTQLHIPLCHVEPDSHTQCKSGTGKDQKHLAETCCLASKLTSTKESSQARAWMGSFDAWP